MAVTQLDIRARTPFFDGAYEQLEGVIQFVVDTQAEPNWAICDIQKAARNAGGIVELAADFALLQPVDAGAGNRTLLMEVVNRGNRGLMSRFNRAPQGSQEPGDGFLFRHGFTLGSVGWQWDVIRGNGLFGVDVPMAVDSAGKPLARQPQTTRSL